jgi:hypothetical protein
VLPGRCSSTGGGGQLQARSLAGRRNLVEHVLCHRRHGDLARRDLVACPLTQLERARDRDHAEDRSDEHEHRGDHDQRLTGASVISGQHPQHRTCRRASARKPDAEANVEPRCEREWNQPATPDQRAAHDRRQRRDHARRDAAHATLEIVDDRDRREAEHEAQRADQLGQEARPDQQRPRWLLHRRHRQR